MISIDLIVLITHDGLYLAFIVTWFIYDLYRNKLRMTRIDGYDYKLLIYGLCKNTWVCLKSWGYPQIIQVMDDHDLVLKPMLTCGYSHFRK